jgi:hypothetical protein
VAAVPVLVVPVDVGDVVDVELVDCVFLVPPTGASIVFLQSSYIIVG